MSDTIDLQGATEAIQKLCDAIKEVWDRIVKVLTEMFNNLWEALKRFLKQTNPKLFKYAFYHKKAKIRKKNLARLLKMFRSVKSTT